MNEHGNIEIHKPYDNQKLRRAPHLPWVMKQTWSDILFVHYPVKRELLERLIPKALTLDTLDGYGWVTIVPYLTSTMRMKGLPAIPGMQSFPGYNIRTYVTFNGKTGVYFFGLTAANWISANMAKIFFNLPYYYVAMNFRRQGNRIEFGGETIGEDALICQYKPITEKFLARKGSLDEWLVERYCLYTTNQKGEPLRCDILHQPWLLQKAEASFFHNELLSKYKILPESTDPILHFSNKVVVRIWPLVSANKY